MCVRARGGRSAQTLVLACDAFANRRYQRKQQRLALQQARQEVADVQARLRTFYSSQAELLWEKLREEDEDFKLRLRHEREIRRQAIGQVKRTQVRCVVRACVRVCVCVCARARVFAGE